MTVKHKYLLLPNYWIEVIFSQGQKITSLHGSGEINITYNIHNPPPNGNSVITMEMQTLKNYTGLWLTNWSTSWQSWHGWQNGRQLLNITPDMEVNKKAFFTCQIWQLQTVSSSRLHVIPNPTSSHRTYRLRVYTAHVESGYIICTAENKLLGLR